MAIPPPRRRRPGSKQLKSFRKRYILLPLIIALIGYAWLAIGARDADAPIDIFESHESESQDRSTGLQEVIDNWVSRHGTGYHVVVRALGPDTGEASYSADVTTVPASTYKLFIAYAAYHQIESGKLSLQTTLDADDTVQSCIEKSLVRSDNDCAEAIGFKIGWERVDQLESAAGFLHTHLNNYDDDGSHSDDKATTAEDISLLLQKLYDGKLLNEPHTENMLGYMKGQVYRNGIPAGSGDALVADKVGFLDGYTHDAAIVYARQPYILVIMTTNSDNWANIRDLSANIYQYMNKA